MVLALFCGTKLAIGTPSLNWRRVQDEGCSVSISIRVICELVPPNSGWIIFICGPSLITVMFTSLTPIFPAVSGTSHLNVRLVFWVPISVARLAGWVVISLTSLLLVRKKIF